ncbi:MAG: ABC transporter permease [Cellulomonadaceae bacterium]|jgi:ABC-2 type transport system permease protein|nr:ABC transporter permease [Cellulomonadaceae bacterium]
MSLTTPTVQAAAAAGPALPAQSAWSSIGLIARREISTRTRAKSWRVTTLIMVAVVVAGVLIAHFAGGLTQSFAVGFTPDVPAATVNAIEATAKAASVSMTASTPASQDAGQALLTSGDLDALVIPQTAGDAPSGAPSFEVVVKQTLDPSLQATFTALAQQDALDAQVTGLGGDPGTVAAAIHEANVQVTALEPEPTIDTSQIVVGLATVIVMYIALMMGSQFVAQGVVEEKSSRVVEILLATVRPTYLMAGKVLGIGVVVLIQMVATVGAAALAAHCTGVLDASAIHLGSMLVWSVAWFLVGFTIFALMLAALASLVSRQEEVGSVTMPALMLAMLPYMYTVTVLLHEPQAQLGKVMSFVPFFAPFLMPVRAAFNVVAPWEQPVALVIAVAFLPVLAWLAGRIYAGAVLRTGARIRLKDALRSA